MQPSSLRDRCRRVTNTVGFNLLLMLAASAALWWGIWQIGKAAVSFFFF